MTDVFDDLAKAFKAGYDAGRNEAADEIERLREALEELLCEAEDIFVCMADATGIDRHNFPLPFYKARAALGETE